MTAWRVWEQVDDDRSLEEWHGPTRKSRSPTGKALRNRPSCERALFRQLGRDVGYWPKRAPSERPLSRALLEADAICSV
jgi:hypothetical protein